MDFQLRLDSGHFVRAMLLIGVTLIPLTTSPLQGSVPVDADSLPIMAQEMREEGAAEFFQAPVESLLRLLNEGDEQRFAAELAISAADFDAIHSEPTDENLLDTLGQTSWHDELASSAGRFLDTLRSAGRDPGEGTWTLVDVEPPEAFLPRLYPGMSIQKVLPHLKTLRIRFSNTDEEFEVTLRELVEFPSGWKLTDLRWSDFPPALMTDEKRVEMKLRLRVENREEIHAADDPWLNLFGEAVLGWFQQESEVNRSRFVLDLDGFKATLQATGQPLPPEEALEFWHDTQGRLFAGLESSARQAQGLGIDFRQHVRVEDVVVRGSGIFHESPFLMEADEILVYFRWSPPPNLLESEPEGVRLILAFGEPIRTRDGWYVALESIRWAELPRSLVSEEANAAMEFENHVAEHDALPVGMMAPEIELFSLDGNPALQLSDFRGKVVVLDFWAVWCGPCQEPLADLQRLKREKTEWEGKVEILTVSIDDDPAVTRAHLERNDWNHTENFWAGRGGWRSPAARSFRVSRLPTHYVIDADGTIRFQGGGVESAVDSLIPLGAGSPRTEGATNTRDRSFKGSRLR